MTADQSGSIVDKLVKVDLGWATSAEEIATALQYTAASAGMANVSLDEMIGMITVVSATTRRSAESIGQSFKTIFSRMQNVSAGKDLDDEGEKLNDVEKRLDSLGIKLRDSVGEWRDMSDVLNEIGGKWKSFNSVEKSSIATALAGTRQRENLIVTFDHWNEVLEASAQAQDSAGTSSQKYEVYMESIDAKVNQFIATWEKLVNNLNQSGTFKAIVDLGTTLLGIVDKLHLVQVAIIGAFSGFAIAGVQKLITHILTLQSNIDKAINIVNKVDNVKNTISGAVEALQHFSKAQQITILNASTLDDKSKQAIANFLRLSFSANTAKVSTLSLAQSFTILKDAFLASPLFPIVAISAAIGGSIALYDLLNTSTEEYKEKIKGLEDEYIGLKNEIDEVQSSIDTNAQRILELSAQDSLTLVEASELEKLKETNKQLELQLKIKDKIKESAQEDLSKETMTALSDMNYTSLNESKYDPDSKTNIIGRAKEGAEFIASKKKELAEQEALLPLMEVGTTLYEVQKKKVDDLRTSIEEEDKTTSGMIETLTEYYGNLTDNTKEEREQKSVIKEIIDNYLKASDAVSYYKDKLSELSSETDSGKKSTEAKDLTTELLSDKEGQDLLSGMGLDSKTIDLGKQYVENVANGVVKSSDEVEDAFATIVDNVIAQSKEQVEDGTEETVSSFISKLSSLKSGLSPLDGIFTDIKDGGQVTADTIKSLTDSFGDINGISDYADAIAKAGKDTKKVKEIVNDVADAYLEQNGVLDNVTDSNYEYITSELKGMGFANADALVQRALIETKAELYAKTHDLSQVTANDMVTALGLEGKEAEQAKDSFYDLKAAMVIANETGLDFSSQKKELIELAKAAGLASNEISGIFGSDLSNKYDNSSRYAKEHGISKEEAGKAILNEQWKSVENSLENSSVKPVYNGSPVKPSGSGSGSSSGDDATIKAFKADKDKIDYLKDMELISTKDYYAQLSALNDKYYKGKTKYIKEYQEQLVALFGIEKQLFEEDKENLETRIDILESQSGTEEERIKLGKQLEDMTHNMAEKLRSQGVVESSESIKELQSAWRGYAQDIESTVLDLTDRLLDNVDDSIDALERKGQLTSKRHIELERQKYAILNQMATQYGMSQEEYQDRLNDIMDEERDALESAFEKAKTANENNIERQIKALEKQKEADSEYFDNKIEKINNVIDSLDEEEEQENKLLDIEEKREALAKAKAQKTAQIYHEGIGFVWDRNAEDVKNAEDDYNQAIKEYNNWQKKLDLQGQIDDFQKAKEENEKNIDEEIEKLNDLKDAWSDSLDLDSEFNEYDDLLQELYDNEDLSYQERLDLVKNFAEKYKEYLADIGNAQSNLSADLTGQPSNSGNVSSDTPVIGSSDETWNNYWNKQNGTTTGTNQSVQTSVSLSNKDTQTINSLTGALEDNTTEVLNNSDALFDSNSNTSSAFQSFFDSYETTDLGNGFYRFVDEAGNLLTATKDYFKYQYANQAGGYTDREQASNFLKALEEVGMLDDYKSNYHEAYVRNLDITNTPENGSRKATTEAREQTQRIYNEILASKNGEDTIYGSYDSTGNKTTGVSFNRDGKIVDTEYSKNAPSFSNIVDSITDTLSDEDIYNSDIYKTILPLLNKGYYAYDSSGNVDETRAYDTSSNETYDSLKISTDNATKSTLSNSDQLKKNANAMNDLNQTFGEGAYDLVDVAGEVVKVVDGLGNTIGAIDTKSGSIYKSTGSTGGSSGKSSSSSNNMVTVSLGDGSLVTVGKSQAEQMAKNAYSNGYTSLGDEITSQISGKSSGSSGSSGSKSSSGHKVIVNDPSIKAYANGIINSGKEDCSLVDDDGTELIIRPPSNGRYTSFEAGSNVLTADITKNLTAFGTNPHEFFERELENQYNKLSKYTTSNNTPNSISVGDIYVSGVQDVNGLSDAIVKKLPNQIIKDMFKN